MFPAPESLLFFPVITAAVHSAWTDWKHAEAPPLDALAIGISAIGAWWIFFDVGLDRSSAAACAWSAVILSALHVQRSLNSAYFRLLLANVAFFWAFGLSVRFLWYFIAAFVFSVAFGALAFFIRTFASQKGRSALSAYWNEGFGKSRRKELAVTAAIAAGYVLSVKALFWVASAKGIMESEHAFLYLALFLAAFPYAVKALEWAFPKNRSARLSAAGTAAALATAWDVSSNGPSAAAASLGAAFAIGMSMAVAMAAFARVLKIYLEASRSSLVGSGDFQEGDVLDGDFFFSRFPVLKNSARPRLSEGKATVEDVAKVREHVSGFRQAHPSVPDEFRILRHLPLAPYALFAGLACAAQVGLR